MTSFLLLTTCVDKFVLITILVDGPDEPDPSRIATQRDAIAVAKGPAPLVRLRPLGLNKQRQAVTIDPVKVIPILHVKCVATVVVICGGCSSGVGGFAEKHWRWLGQEIAHLRLECAAICGSRGSKCEGCAQRYGQRYGRRGRRLRVMSSIGCVLVPWPLALGRFWRLSGASVARLVLREAQRGAVTMRSISVAPFSTVKMLWMSGSTRR